MKEVEVCGYPRGKIMKNAFGPYKLVTDSFLHYRIPTMKGQSGSPIIKREEGKKFIIGVHIASDDEGKKNIAVRLTPQKRKIINQWVGEITGELDLSKLGFI